MVDERLGLRVHRLERLLNQLLLVFIVAIGEHVIDLVIGPHTTTSLRIQLLRLSLLVLPLGIACQLLTQCISIGAELPLLVELLLSFLGSGDEFGGVDDAS